VFPLVNLFNRIHPAPPHGGPEAAARVERRAMAMWPRLNSEPSTDATETPPASLCRSPAAPRWRAGRSRCWSRT